MRPRLSAGGPGARAYRAGATRPCARGLVPALRRLSPLLPEPPPTDAGVFTCRRRAAASRVIVELTRVKVNRVSIRLTGSPDSPISVRGTPLPTEGQLSGRIDHDGVKA